MESMKKACVTGRFMEVRMKVKVKMLGWDQILDWS